VKLLVLTLLLCSIGVSALANSWEVKVVEDSMRPKSPTVFATVDSSNKNASIVVGCMNNLFLVLYLHKDAFFAERMSSIDVKIDSEDPFRVGTFGSDGNSTGIRDTSKDKFVSALKKGSKIIIRSMDYTGMVYTEEFSLKGSTKAINTVRNICNQ
jgi:hypothetical protein